MQRDKGIPAGLATSANYGGFAFTVQVENNRFRLTAVPARYSYEPARIADLDSPDVRYLPPCPTADDRQHPWLFVHLQLR